MLSFVVSSLYDAFRQLQFKTLTLITMNIQDTDQRHGNFYLTNFAGISFLVSALLTKNKSGFLGIYCLELFL